MSQLREWRLTAMLRVASRGGSTRKATVESGTTELTRLPGLEVPEVPVPQTSGERGRWIERGPSGKLMLFSGRSNPELSERIAELLNISLGEVELETFANGETYCRYCESIRGADVFLIQSCHGLHTNDHLMELVIMIQAAKLASANRITAVMPWYPYSRQDKKSAPREPITAKLVSDMLLAAGVDRILTMDLHAGQIQGFVSIPVDHMTALPLFAQYYRDKGLHGDDVVAVSPDPGRAKMARKFGEMLEADLAIMNKTRPARDSAAVTEVIGRVEGKVAIMTDDIVVTGGTLIAGAQALKDAGATEVYACATHALIPESAFEKLGHSELKEIAVTDTVPVNPLLRPDNFPEPLTVSILLADTIKNVFSDESVSAIFAGENQLF
jgi:ribose-phosphate pyrophosphokinase